MSDSPTLSAATFRWLTLGVMIFSLYGSFVPFRFHTRTPDNALDGYQWALETRWRIQSRSDFAANLILGLPLGFCLLAAARLDKPFNAALSLVAGVLLWPWCVAFAAAIEFAQLFFYERTCSGSDIIAQAIGSALGMMIWVAFGERLVRLFRRVWQGDRIGGTAGRIMLAYLGLLALVQWLPLDLTLSPADVYHKYRDGKFIAVPFEELKTVGFKAKLPSWLEFCGLYFLAGALGAGIVKSPWNRSKSWPELARGLMLAAVFEGGQMFVVSRTTSVTDVLFGSVSVFCGWLLVRVILPKPGQGLSLNIGLLLGQAWLALLLAINWLPFNFNRYIMLTQLESVNWIPFAAAYEKNYLSSLEEALAKTLLYAPLGAIVAALGIRRVVKKRPAILLGLLASTLIEAGQLALPSRVASPTDLIFGAVGGWLGAATALRLRAYGFGALPPSRNPVRFRVK